MLLVQTLLSLLALALMAAGVAVAIRLITKWRRRVEQIDPERDEKAEKDRQRALFVNKNLKTRVWTARPCPAEVEEEGSHHPFGTTTNAVASSSVVPLEGAAAGEGRSVSATADGRPAGAPSPTSAHPSLSSSNDYAAPPRSPRGNTSLFMMNRGINNNTAERLDFSHHSSSSTSSSSPSEDGHLDSATSSDVTASSSSSTTSSRHGRPVVDIETGGLCDESGAGARAFGAGSTAASMLSSSALSLHNGGGNSAGGGGGGECAICSRTFRHNRDVVCDSNNTSCRHVFHASCMRRWLMLNPNCPLCRHEYLLHFVPKWRAAPPSCCAPGRTPSSPRRPGGAVGAPAHAADADALPLPAVLIDGSSSVESSFSAEPLPGSNARGPEKAPAHTVAAEA